MERLPKQFTKTFYLNPETGYYDLKARWVASKFKNPGHHLIYQILRGRDWKRAFTESETKPWAVLPYLANFEAYLEPFLDLLRPDIVNVLKNIVPTTLDFVYPDQANSYNFGWVYVLVRRDIEPAHQLVQAGHAAYVGSKITDAKNPSFVVLGVDIKDLYEISYKLKTLGIKFTLYKDKLPSFNSKAPTALCTEPLWGENRELFKDYKIDTIMV